MKPAGYTQNYAEYGDVALAAGLEFLTAQLKACATKMAIKVQVEKIDQSWHPAARGPQKRGPRKQRKAKAPFY